MALITIIAAFLVGVTLRFWGEEAEARQLRLANMLIRPGEEGECALEPAALATVVERTRMALGAAKLARIAALLVLLPTTLLLVREAWHALYGRHWASAQFLYFSDFLAAAGMFSLFLALHGVSGWLAARRATLEDEPAPAWLVEREAHVPIIVTGGWLLWENAMSSFDWILAGIHASRPQAQLFQIDEMVRLEIVTEEHPVAPAEPAGNPSSGKRQRTEAEMIRAIQRLDRTFVREIMRPINRVVAISLREYSPRRFLELCRRTGYTRIPVYEDHITNLVGYINVYSIIDETTMPEDLRSLVTKPIYVPETARVNAVLQEMISKRQQVAIVFDEFGGTSGWFSREDIFEEIVGDVEDEYKRPRRMIVQTAEGYVVDPAMDLDDLREATGLSLSKKNCDTLGGYVYYRLGRVPRRGETIEEKGWKIRVAALDNHRIRRVRLTSPPRDEAEEPDES